MKNIIDDATRLEHEYRLRQSIDYHKPLRDMEKRLGVHSQDNSTHRHIHLTRRWLAYAAAVLLLLAATNVLTYTFSHQSADNAEPATIASNGQDEHILLADGTEVWLNSASTLEYDDHFGQTERRVKLTGEAYFKVAKDASKPFYVDAGDQVIKVVGTEFNVCAYADEPVVRTTLVTGKITMKSKSANGSELMVKPGSQVEYNRQDKSMRVHEVNAENAASWKDGFFAFDGLALDEVMHTLSHSYSFTYEFADTIAAHAEINGRIDRTMPFAQVVKMLEYTGGIDLIVKGKHIIIRSKK